MQHSYRTFWKLIASLCLVASLGLTGCGAGGSVTSVSPSTPVAAVAPSIWVGAWGDAITNAEPNPENNGGTDRSYRFQITPTIGGTQERVRFSNKFGKTPVVIGTARLSVGTAGSAVIDAAQDQPLSFNGQPGITLAPGQVVTSDPVFVTFNFGQVLDVSVFLKGSYGAIARHHSLFITNYRTADGAGDHTTDPTGASYTATHGEWLLINGVDVYGQYQGTIAVFGSSTTDGFHSNYSSDQVYPVPNQPVAGQHRSRLSDQLANRLNALGYRIGVVNEGIPNDTVTVDASSAATHVQNANDRIMADVLSLPNLLAMVTYFGSIDIRSAECKSAPEIEAATQQMITTAANAKVPVILATIPPSAFCTNPAQANYGPTPSAADPYAGGVTSTRVNGGELQRIALNEWMRNVAVNLPGVSGIADFEKAMTDPAHPSFLLPQYNSGDNYHPNGLGYKTEAESIPLMGLPAPK